VHVELGHYTTTCAAPGSNTDFCCCMGDTLTALQELQQPTLLCKSTLTITMTGSQPCWNHSSAKLQTHWLHRRQLHWHVLHACIRLAPKTACQTNSVIASPCEQLSVRVAKEAAHISTTEGKAGQAKSEHHGHTHSQVAPLCCVVTRPYRPHTLCSCRVHNSTIRSLVNAVEFVVLRLLRTAAALLFALYRRTGPLHAGNPASSAAATAAHNNNT
jgi:hypothetical protein